MAQQFKSAGLVLSAPTSPASPAQSEARISVDFCQAYRSFVSGVVFIDETSLTPQEILGVPAIHGLVIYVPNGESMTLLITSAAGVDQAVRVSSAFVLHSPLDTITSVKVYGVGTIEYMLAGN